MLLQSSNSIDLYLIPHGQHLSTLTLTSQLPLIFNKDSYFILDSAKHLVCQIYVLQDDHSLHVEECFSVKGEISTIQMLINKEIGIVNKKKNRLVVQKRENDDEDVQQWIKEKFIIQYQSLHQEEKEQNIAITSDKRVYIGSKMFKAFTKENQKGWIEFEQHRHKEVHIQDADQIHNEIFGPIMSSDRQWIIYAYEIEAQNSKRKSIRKPSKSVYKSSLSRRLSSRQLSYFKQSNFSVQNILSLEILPVLDHNQFFLLPQDIQHLVRYSTFTPKGDIFLVLNDVPLILDSQGGRIDLITSDTENQTLQSSTLVQIKPYLKYDLAILLSDQTNYHVLILSYSQKDKTYSLEEKHKFQKLCENARLDMNADVYQAGTEKVFKNDQEMVEFSQLVRQSLVLEKAAVGQENVVQVDKNKVIGKIKKGKQVKSEEEQRRALLSQVQDEQMYRFEIIHDKYFVIKTNEAIYFTTIDPLQPEMTKLNLNLRPGLITEIHQTQIDNQLQFAYVQFKPVYKNFVITWNLDNNTEVQLFESPINYLKPEIIQIVKGVSERLNYFFPKNNTFYFDMRFEYPINFIDSCLNLSKFNRTLNQQISEQYTLKLTNELKLSSEANLMLGFLNNKATIQLTCKSLNLEYLEFLMKKETYQSDSLIMDLVNFRLEDGRNVLHFMKGRQEFLQVYKQKIKTKKEFQFFIYYVVFPDLNHQSPFESLLKEGYSPRCLELMFEILTIDSSNDYFTHMKEYFFQFLDFQSPSFINFFETCTDQLSLQVKCPWNFKNEKILYLTHHTQYICKDFVEKQLKLQKGYFERQFQSESQDKEIEKTFIAEDGLIIDKRDQTIGLSYQKNPASLMENKKQSVAQQQQISIYTYDFGWLVQGSVGQEFIHYLTQNNDLELFQMKTIQTIINVQWKLFRNYYWKYQFIPFCIYFVLLVMFNTVMNPNIYSLNRIIEYDTKDRRDGNFFFILHEIFGYIMMCFVIYFIQLQVRKIRRTRTILDYFQLFFHSLVVLFFALDQVTSYSDTHIIYIKIGDAQPAEEYFYIIFSAVLIVLAYFCFLIQLRTFDTFAVLINMMIEVMKETKTFLFIFLFINCAFGNAMFILAMLERPDTSTQKFTGPSIFTAIIYSYRQTIGDIQDYSTQINQGVYDIFQVATTLLLNVMSLNLLISIISDIYGRVSEAYKTQRLRAKCRLINENEALFDREKLFKDARYVIRIEREQFATNTQSGEKEQHTVNQQEVNEIVRQEVKKVRVKLQQQIQKDKDQIMERLEKLTELVQDIKKNE